MKTISEGEMNEILWEYSEWLHKKGYIDTDFYTEEPYAVDGFLKDKKQNENRKKQNK